MRYFLFQFMLISVIFIRAREAQAQALEFQQLSRILPANIYMCFAKCDTLLFIGGDDLGIVDISDPAQPEFLSLTPVARDPWGNFDKINAIYRRGDYLYLWLDSHASGLTDSIGVVDISDLYSPQVISRISMPNQQETRDFAMTDSMLFVASQVDGDVILDIYRISNVIPQYIDSFDPGYIGALEVMDDYVLISSYGNLEIYQWNGSIMQPIGSVSGVWTSNNDYNCYSGGFSYILYQGVSQLQIVSVENPQAPYIVGVYNLPAYQQVLQTVAENFMVIGQTQLFLYDVSSPLNPVFIDTLNSVKGGWRALYQDSILYTIYYNYDERGVDINSLVDPAAPERLSTIFAERKYDFLKIPGQDFIVVAEGMRLILLDVSEPDNPQMVWSMLENVFIRDLEISQDYIFARVKNDYSVDNYYIIVIDISDIYNPEIVNQQTIPLISGGSQDFYIGVEGRLFVSSARASNLDDTWYIFNITNPLNIILQDSVSMFGQDLQCFASAGELTVVWEKGALSFTQSKVNFFRYTPDGEPRWLAGDTLNHGYLNDGIINNDLFIVGSSSSCIDFYDISNPQIPEWLLAYNTCEGIYTLQACGDTLYAGGYSYIWAFDIGNLPVIAVIDSFYIGSTNKGLIVEDDLIYTIGAYSGFHILSNSLQSVLPVPLVDIIIEGDDVGLSWENLPGVMEFRIYYSEIPYFTPSGPPNAVVLPPSNNWVDVNAVNAGQRFYRIIAVY